jgi:hypothetical protein
MLGGLLLIRGPACGCAPTGLPTASSFRLLDAFATCLEGSGSCGGVLSRFCCVASMAMLLLADPGAACGPEEAAATLATGTLRGASGTANIGVSSMAAIGEASNAGSRCVAGPCVVTTILLTIFAGLGSMTLGLRVSSP